MNTMQNAYTMPPADVLVGRKDPFGHGGAQSGTAPAPATDLDHIHNRLADAARVSQAIRVHLIARISKLRGESVAVKPAMDAPAPAGLIDQLSLLLSEIEHCQQSSLDLLATLAAAI